jgi:hypothetical protein
MHEIAYEIPWGDGASRQSAWFTKVRMGPQGHGWLTVAMLFGRCWAHSCFLGSLVDSGSVGSIL